jgi:hypothetical protein
MDHKSAIEWLVQAEAGFDVNSLQAQGELLWPLARLNLNKKLLEFEMDDPSSTFRQAGGSLVRRWLAGARAMLANPARLNQLRRLAPEIIFFANPKHYRFHSGGQAYNYLLDPWVEFAARFYRVAKVEVQLAGQVAPVQRLVPATVLEEFTPPAARARYMPPLQNVTAFNQVAASLPGDVALDARELVRQFERIQQRARWFARMFAHIAPRAVFLVNFYDPRNLAIVLACRTLNIPVVDIQHGKQGKYHAMYNHWTKIPPQGYRLLPDYFWVWGEESRLNILQGRQGNTAQHQPLVGGNLWMQKWKQTDWYTPGEDERALLETTRGRARVILFSAQPIAEPFPAPLVQAMKTCPPNWRWLVRLHPRQVDALPRYEAELRSLGVQNFEMRLSSQVPLYWLMRQCHYHITCWSTVCYEALVFGLPTSIVHENGKSLFDEYIRRNIFLYAADGATLNEQILHAHSAPEETPYIVADENIAKTTFDNILQKMGA